MPKTPYTQQYLPGSPTSQKKTAQSKRINQLKNHHKAASAIDWLAQDARHAGLVATVKEVLALESAISTVLPPATRITCHVIKRVGDTLSLASPNSAQAAKLRQMTPRIQAFLEQRGWKVSRILVQVQARSREQELNTTSQLLKKPPPPEIGSTGLAAFSALKPQLREGPLTIALTKLLERRTDKTT